MSQQQPPQQQPQPTPQQITAAQRETLLSTLQARFEQHPNRHPTLQWADILTKLHAHQHKLGSLHEMERTGGEPDVVGYDANTGEYIFMDCSAETPKGRRNICYDKAALDARKEFKPEHSAVEMAAEMGIQLLTEEQYRALQQLGHFDSKTSSWIATPANIRKLGGALFCDRRYDHVFTYHNGAQSYYAVRGFRGWLGV